MILQPLKKAKELTFERTYPVPVDTVWRAWTQADMLREWWGPEKTTVPECEIDLRVGGTIRIVTEAGEGMGKYQGTRWPMVGTFSLIDENVQLTYDARSWTEGEEEASTIHHLNDLTLTSNGQETVVRLRVTITKIGPKAKLAAFGMKWGYRQYLDKLDLFLSAQGSGD